MDCRPFRFKQRRTSVTGRKPTLASLYDGELYLNTADGKGYFKDNTRQNLHTFITDASGNGLNNIKFSGASYGDVPVWNGSGFSPSGLSINIENIDLSSYVTTGQTGNFVSTSQTGNFATIDQIGNFGYSVFTTGEVVSEESLTTITGLRYFDSSISSNWYSNYAWFSDSSLEVNSNDLPYDFTRVKICNNNPVLINLDNPLWVQPKSIDSSSILDGIGVCLFSAEDKIFSGAITGDFSLFGNSIFSGASNQGNFNQITCVQTGTNTYVSYGECSYLITGNNNVLSSSSYSIILNGTGNTLHHTQNSAIIGSCINISHGQPDTLYVKNICLVNNGKIYGDGSQLINVSGSGSVPINTENPFHSASSVCCFYTSSNNNPINLNIYEPQLNQNVFFSACIISQGSSQFSSHKIEGMIRRESQECEDFLNTNSIKFINNPSKSIFSKSNSLLDVNMIANIICGTLDLQIIGHSSESMDWFSKVELLKIIKQ